jgi:hypothetical protein
MKKINIAGYPHAAFYEQNKVGYLAFYYSHGAVKEGTLDENSWRYGSYSSKILDFKEGHDKDIQFFVPPFCDLLRQVESGRFNHVYLIPVPTSIRWNDPRFTHFPRKGPSGRNRDDRNIIFCKKISIEDSRYEAADLLRRKKSKPPKGKWKKEDQKGSLEFKPGGLQIQDAPDNLLVLVDDVYTSGGTIAGARLLLEEKYPKSEVIALTIGRSRSPEEFEPTAR